MGMNLAAASASADPEVLVDINTTPLIDVLLVLLIMLIITIPIQLHSVNMNMPIGDPPPPESPPEVVRITIDPAGVVFFDGEVVDGGDALELRLAAIAAAPVPPELHVSPDKAVPYRAVVTVMAAIQRKGLTKVGLVGAEQFL